MDLKAISDQILMNIDHFEPDEKKVIILKLIDFINQKEEENLSLNQKNTDLLEENQVLKTQQFDESEYKARIDEIIDLANGEAKKIVDSAHLQVEDKIHEIEVQGKDYIFELLSRMENLVENMKLLDEEAKMYRLHVLTIFRKTIFRFSESDYHIIKVNDNDLKELLQFYRDDEELQKFSDQIISKLSHFEKYLQLNLESIQDEDLKGLEMNKLEQILEENFVIESNELESTDLEKETAVEKETITEKTVDKKEEFFKEAPVDEVQLNTKEAVEKDQEESEPVVNQNTKSEQSVSQEEQIDNIQPVQNENNALKEEASIAPAKINDFNEVPSDKNRIDKKSETNEKFIDIFNKYYR